ncbi:MAG: MTH938/NDUFAF3 family protein [Xanthobacteraceae bacterium]
MDDPHLPRQAPIEAHGGGGFRLAGLSHRGSLLCLPDGVWAWPVSAPRDLTDDHLAPIFSRADNLDFFILGTGAAPWIVPDRLRLRFREAHISLDAMTTGPAIRTYNVMLMEGRRLGAGLIAIGG